VTTPKATDEGTFSLRRVQEMLGLSRTVLSGLIAAGFVTPARGPRNALRFSFQDLMLLRTAHALHAARIPPRKILQSLAKLRASLPEALPITGLRITAVGANVAVRDRDTHWDADSGQLLMDFEVAPRGGSIAFLAPEPPAADPARAAFERATALESTDAGAAEHAYRDALALAPDYVDAYLNLGAMLCERARCDEAVALYDAAVERCPESALIHFNRAIALEDQQRCDDAVASYERCLVLDASLADAHFNLGRLQERLGDARSALRHFSAYRRLQR
jgi:hypothetical protein